jgi:hypothetical protein
MSHLRLKGLRTLLSTGHPLRFRLLKLKRRVVVSMYLLHTHDQPRFTDGCVDTKLVSPGTNMSSVPLTLLVLIAHPCLSDARFVATDTVNNTLVAKSWRQCKNTGGYNFSKKISSS